MPITDDSILNANPTGPNSLNDAISDANSGLDVLGTFGPNVNPTSAADSIAIALAANGGSLTLDGDDYTLDATGSAAFNALTISNGTVTIENLNITNFSGGDTGAAISIAANATVIFEQGSASNDLTDTNIGVINAGIVGGGNVQVGEVTDDPALLPLILNSANTYTGATTIYDTLLLGANGSIADSSAVALEATTSGTYGVLNVAEVTSSVSGSVGAPLTLVNQLTVQNLSGVSGSIVYLGNNSLTIDETSSGGTTFSGQIENGDATIPSHQNSSINVEGSGAFTIDNVQLYTGATRIYGTLDLTSNGSIADSDNVSLKQSGASLNLVAGSDPTYCIQELTGVSGTSVNIGDNTLIVQETGVNAAYTGAITGSGTFELGSEGSATLTLNGTGDFLGFSGMVQVDGSMALAGSAAFDTFFPGVSATLTGASCVQVDGYLDVSGVTGFSGTVTVESLSGDGCVFLGANYLIVDYASASYDSSFCGDISGTGGLQVGEAGSTGAFTRGTLTLGGDNCYTGSTKIYGDLVLDSYCAIADSHNVSLKVAGATLDVCDDGATIQELTGVSGTWIVLGCENLTVTEDASSATFSGTIEGYCGSSFDVEAACSGTTYALTLTADDSTAGSGTGFYGDVCVGSGAILTLAANGSIADAQNLAVYGDFDISADSNAIVVVNNLSGCDSSATIVLGSNTLSVGLGYVDGGSGCFTYTEFDGVISGTGGLTTTENNTSGFGALLLGGVETYTGNTTIGSGTALVLLENSIDSTNKVIDNGILVFEANDTFTPVIQGAGEVWIGGGEELDSALVNDDSSSSSSCGPTVTFESAETYTGETDIACGATLVLGAAASIADSSLVFVDGTLDLSGVVTSGTVMLNQLAGDNDCALVNLGGNTLEIVQSGSCYFDGVIEGSGSVLIDANATLNLADSTSTYTGKTVVTGELTLDDGASLDSHNVSLKNTAILYVTDGCSSINELTGQSGTSIYISEGTLIVTENVTNATFAGGITGDGNLEIASGPDILTLLGPEGYTGSTTVDAGGFLDLSASGSISASEGLTVDGTFDVSSVTTSGTTSVIDLTGAGHVVLGSINMVDTVQDGYLGSPDVFSGVISGSGSASFTVDGSDGYSASGTEVSSSLLTLSGNNTFSGGLVIAGGTVELTNSHAAGTGVISFAGSTTQTEVTTGTFDTHIAVLQIDNSALNGVGTGAESFTPTINGSTMGVAGSPLAIIDLPGLTYGGNADESIVTYNNGAQLLTVSEGNVAVVLNVTGIGTAATLAAYEDSHGGTFLVFDTTGAAAYDASHYHP